MWLDQWKKLSYARVLLVFYCYLYNQIYNNGNSYLKFNVVTADFKYKLFLQPNCICNGLIDELLYTKFFHPFSSPFCLTWSYLNYPCTTLSRPWQEALAIHTLCVNKGSLDKTQQLSSCVHCNCPVILSHPPEQCLQPEGPHPKTRIILYTNTTIYIYTIYIHVSH